MNLAPEILARLAADYAKRPWAVYVHGTGDVLFCPQDHLPFEPCKGKFDRLGAIAYAEQVRANLNAARSMHGIDAIPECTPYVLCYGIVWAER